MAVFVNGLFPFTHSRGHYLAVNPTEQIPLSDSLIARVRCEVPDVVQGIESSGELLAVLTPNGYGMSASLGKNC